MIRKRMGLLTKSDRMNISLGGVLRALLVVEETQSCDQ